MTSLSQRLIRVSAALTGLLFVATGCAAVQNSDATPSPSASASFLADARAYCAEKGGEVQERQPTFGTNNAKTEWVSLGEKIEVCQFRTDQPTKSQIILDLKTLYSTQPTLAALAYLAKHTVKTEGPVNPASVLCTSLNGASSYGSGPAGGGLYLEGATDDQLDILSPCTFADGSMIDDWGISYYGNGIVRGHDLTDVFRFDTTKAIDIFG